MKDSSLKFQDSSFRNPKSEAEGRFKISVSSAQGRGGSTPHVVPYKALVRAVFVTSGAFGHSNGFRARGFRQDAGIYTLR
jgi:hypothetical protein